MCIEKMKLLKVIWWKKEGNHTKFKSKSAKKGRDRHREGETQKCQKFRAKSENMSSEITSYKITHL